MLSWLPVYNSWMVLVGVISIFFWKLWGVMLFFCAGLVSLWFVIQEVLLPEANDRYTSAFWLFILSEVAVFGSLFAALVWSEDGLEGPLSDSLELPLLGCFLLLTSSLTATIYHHCFGVPYSYFFLAISAILGFCFVCVQLWEFFDCECDVLYCSYLGAAFCTVGLHFTHVFGGVVAMIIMLLWGANKSPFYASVVVWYWHFVDYVWLWVYLLIYYI